MHRILSLTALCLVSSPAAAAETLQLAAFKQLELSGGGEVVVRHGPRQQVRLLSGSTNISRVEVDDRGRLLVQACKSRCPRGYKLQVEIVSPRLSGLAINGGGIVRTAGAFPRHSDLALAVNGGGLLDARAIQASSVAAAINGGGLINTHPASSLTAAVHGGGAIRYWGVRRSHEPPSTAVTLSGCGTRVEHRACADARQAWG